MFKVAPVEDIQLDSVLTLYSLDADNACVAFTALVFNMTLRPFS